MAESVSAHPGKIWTNTLGMKFAVIPAGEFRMGSPDGVAVTAGGAPATSGTSAKTPPNSREDTSSRGIAEPERFDNETPHRVRITRSFSIGVTAVTVAQFAEFVKETGYQTAAEKEGWAYGIWNLQTNQWDKHDGASWKNPHFEQSFEKSFAQGPDHPVVDVNWNDAVAFCQWLSGKEGRAYRLPTEAEWEYACRAGTATTYIWGDNPDDGKGWANCSDATAKDVFKIFPPFEWSDGYLYTSPVASFRPNAWGLYDMIGNTLEWCSDWFADYPAGDASGTTEVTDPTGPADGPVGSQQRCLRGGAFVYGPKHCRSSFRGRNWPEFRNYYIGFRVVSDP